MKYIVMGAVALVFLLILAFALSPNEQERAAEQQREQKAADTRYHNFIDKSVFSPSLITSDTKEWLKPIWNQVNTSRVAASKLAIDQSKCPSVESADPSPDPAVVGNILVTCKGGPRCPIRRRPFRQAETGLTCPTASPPVR